MWDRNKRVKVSTELSPYGWEENQWEGCVSNCVQATAHCPPADMIPWKIMNLYASISKVKIFIICVCHGNKQAHVSPSRLSSLAQLNDPAVKYHPAATASVISIKISTNSKVKLQNKSITTEQDVGQRNGLSVSEEPCLFVAKQVKQTQKLPSKAWNRQSFMSTQLSPYHNVNYFGNITELIYELWIVTWARPWIPTTRCWFKYLFPAANICIFEISCYRSICFKVQVMCVRLKLYEHDSLVVLLVQEYSHCFKASGNVV